MAVPGGRCIERSDSATRFAKPSRPDDEALIAAMIRRDERAFRTFFDIYFPRVHRFALRRLGGDVEAARDVVQSTLAKALRNLSGYRRQARLFTWLCQICRREIFDLISSRERRARHLVLIDDHFDVGGMAEGVEEPVAQDPQEAFDAAEVSGLIRSVLNALPRRYADVLEWKYMHGCSVRDIGVRLGMGEVAAQSVLARARAAFRISLRLVLGPAAAEILCNVSGEWQ